MAKQTIATFTEKASRLYEQERKGSASRLTAWDVQAMAPVGQGWNGTAIE